MGRVQDLVRVLRTPEGSIDEVVDHALRLLIGEGRPSDDPRIVAERLEVLQRAVETHKRAYRLAEAVFSQRLRDEREARTHQQAVAHRLRRQVEASTGAGQALQELLAPDNVGAIGSGAAVDAARERLELMIAQVTELGLGMDEVPHGG